MVHEILQTKYESLRTIEKQWLDLLIHRRDGLPVLRAIRCKKRGGEPW